MAKTLVERIESAKATDRVTISDLQTLIADAKAEHERLTGSAAHHDAESINFALSDDDREEASRLAGHFQRSARGLINEIRALSEKLEAKCNSESRKADEAARTAIVGRRDELAERLKARLPALLDELTGLLGEIVASDAEIRPLRLASAEAVARDVPGNFRLGSAPLKRFTEIRLPQLSGSGDLWPVAQPHILAMSFDSMAAARKRMSDDTARENARWSRYMVEGPRNGTRTFIETRRGPLAMSRHDRGHADMTVEGVKDAEANGCTVTPLKPNETVGLPLAAAILA
jgi:hypothetical protein